MSVGYEGQMDFGRAGRAIALAFAIGLSVIGCNADSAEGPTQLEVTPSTVPLATSVDGAVGRKDATVGSAMIGSARPERLSALRDLVADSLPEWNKVLDSIAKSSKRGEQTVALRRQALRALGAPNDVALRQELMKLRISWVDSVGAKQGKAGFYRHYFVAGNPRAKSFFERSSNESRKSPAVDGRGVENLPPTEDPHGTIRSGPSDSETDEIMSTIASVQPTCEYEGLPDDCATQEDIEALETLVAAIDIEIYGQEQLIEYGGGCDSPCEPEIEVAGMSEEKWEFDWQESTAQEQSLEAPHEQTFLMDVAHLRGPAFILPAWWGNCGLHERCHSSGYRRLRLGWSEVCSAFACHVGAHNSAAGEGGRVHGWRGTYGRLGGGELTEQLVSVSAV